MYYSLRNSLISVLALVISIPFLSNAQSFDENTDVDVKAPQEDTSDVKMPDENIFIIVEDMPEFPGGENALRKFLAENYRYPEDAIENNIEGKIFVTFVVRSSGKINDIKVLKGLCTSCDEEAIRVINSMPKWKPGHQRGKAVSVQFTIPFILKLD